MEMAVTTLLTWLTLAAGQLQALGLVVKDRVVKVVAGERAGWVCGGGEAALGGGCWGGRGGGGAELGGGCCCADLMCWAHARPAPAR